VTERFSSCVAFVRIDMDGKEYTRRARERVEQRESGVMAARHREFALAVAELRD
jgi:hypothetical protein